MPSSGSVPAIDVGTVEALFEAPVVTRPQWAPGGRCLVYSVARSCVASNRAWSEFWILNTDHLQTERLVSNVPGTDPAFCWSPDGSQLAYLEAGDDEDRIVVLGLDGSRYERVLVDVPHGRIVKHPFFRTFTWSPIDDRLLYAAHDITSQNLFDPVVNPRNDGDTLGEVERIRLWVYDLKVGGRTRAITSDQYHSGAAVWLSDGHTVVFVSNRSGREEGVIANLTQPFEIWSANADRLREHCLVQRSGATLVPTPSADGRNIGFLEASSRGPHADNMVLATVDCIGADRRVLTLGDDQGIDIESGLAASPDDSWVFVALDGMRNVLTRIREGAAPQSLDQRLPYSTMPDVDTQAGEIVCVSQSATDPPEIELMGIEGRRRWRSSHAGINTFSRPRVWKLSRDDGTTIESMALEPQGSLSGVILWPHGGPHSRSAEEYRPDWEAAIRHGFAVVAPNFRGSHGYGREFLLANRCDLMGADYRDCLAALNDWTVITSSEEVPAFVAGSSYGGYFVAWAVGHTHRFVAAVAINAVANIESFYAQTDIPSWVEWEFGGTPFTQRWLIRDRSPIQHLAGATTPTLVVHSAEDRRVPISQGLELHAALRAAGVVTGFVRYPREYHRIAEPAHRADLAVRMLNWFVSNDS